MAVTKTLRMSFKNEGGKVVSISVADPKDSLTGAEVTTVMDTIISANIFTSSGGDLVEKYDAKIIETTTEDLYTPGE